MTQPVNDKTQFGLLIVAVASLFLTIGFYSGAQKADALKQKLELSEFADSAKLSELISNMRKTSDELSKNISNNNLLLENSKLKNDFNKISTENESLTSELKVKEKFINDLGLSHGSFSLKPHETKILFNGNFIVSLEYTNYSSVNLVINNESVTLGIGKYHKFNTGSNDAKLVLESTSESGISSSGIATFTILVSNNISNN
ncbi:MAG: hypothetical protein HY885_16685 [Deltaproteobacteria bacterium]|nr:hypothetical protein [Deltaproteobacteria bacterium]